MRHKKMQHERKNLEPIQPDSFDFKNLLRGASSSWQFTSWVIAVVLAVYGTVRDCGERDFQREVRNRETMFVFIDKATTSPSEEARIASIWGLAAHWKTGSDSDLTVLANTLATILVSDPSNPVRLTAAEVIGVAYNQDTPSQNQKHLARILYGSTETWEVGSIVAQAWLLRSNPDPNKQYDSKQAAIAEAIRKNWEYLDEAHFRNMDLRGISLYEGHLSRACLQEADLSFADLRGAFLENADVREANFLGANVADVHVASPIMHLLRNLAGDIFNVPPQPGLIDYALSRKAVIMDKTQWEIWKKFKHQLPPDDAWERWRLAKFSIDQKGRPKY